MLLFASLSLGLLATQTACRTDLQHDLQEGDANEIVVLLEQNGIAASKAREGRTDEWVVSVPATEASRSWQILAAHGLPRRRVEGFEEAFGEPSLLPSPVEERVRLQQATAGQLERSIMAIDRIVDARVHLVIPTPERLGGRRDEVDEPQASVLVVYRENGDGPIPLDVEAVRQLVTAAVAGLSPENVAVVTTPRAEPATDERPSLTRFGPLLIATSSRQPLQVLLGALGGLILVLSAVIVVLVFRRRRPAAG